MKTFTIKEYQTRYGYSSYNGADKSIDSLINKISQGKLKGKVERGNDFIDGQLTKVVLISEDLVAILDQKKARTIDAEIVEDYTSQNFTNNDNIDPETSHSHDSEAAETDDMHYLDKYNFSLVNEVILAKNQSIAYANIVGKAEKVEEYNQELKQQIEELKSANNKKIKSMQKEKVILLSVVSAICFFFIILCIYLVSLNFDNINKNAALSNKVIMLEKQKEIDEIKLKSSMNSVKAVTNARQQPKRKK